MNSRNVSLVLLLLALTGTCLAQTWDATRDFAAQNPNGAWSYGFGNTGSTLTLYTIYNPDCGQYVQGLVCWTAEEYVNTPLVGFNTTGGWLDDGGALVAPNVLIMHPAPNWEPADSIVQWTAPTAGTYRISGFFEILDSVNPTGIIGLVYRNGTPLFRAEILGPPAQPPDQIGGRANFYFPQVMLDAGDVISFGVNSDGNFYYDTTGFNATIVSPPDAPACAVCSQQGRSQ